MTLGSEDTIMERLYSFPIDAKHFHQFESDECIKAHPAYTKAKAGNPESAFKLVTEISVGFIKRLTGEFPVGTNYVAPFAKEATGDNAIPLLLSILCSQILQGNNETDIVQQQRVYHTGADPMERLRLRPSFEGWVEPSANYVLVDDVVSMGGTLAELANFIQLNSGKVLGSIVLVNAGRDKAFNPKKKDIRLLEERFNEEIKEIFGIHVSALTANEASYLVGFRTADEIRNRRAKAEKETNLRLLSKGFS